MCSFSTRFEQPNMCCNLDPLKAHPPYPARSTAPITTRACFTMSMPVSSHIASNSSSRQGDGCGEETIESPPSDEPSSSAALDLGIYHPHQSHHSRPLRSCLALLRKQIRVPHHGRRARADLGGDPAARSGRVSGAAALQRASVPSVAQVHMGTSPAAPGGRRGLPGVAVA